MKEDFLHHVAQNESMNPTLNKWNFSKKKLLVSIVQSYTIYMNFNEF